MRPSREGKREWLLAVALISCVVPCTLSLAKNTARNSELGSGWRLDPKASGLSIDDKLARNRPAGCISSSSQQSPCLGSVGPELRGGSQPRAKDSEAIPGASEAAGWLDGDESLVALGTASSSQLVLRACFLVVVFLFPVVTAGLAYLSSWFREKIWYATLTRSLALSGTAFIKWGQWSSTRPDMFPEGLCKSLSVLHKGAPAHKYAYTKKLVERAYGGRCIDEVFEWFDKRPMASGSIAQVHKGVLNGVAVAVKVRHPKVKKRIFMDFLIMKKLAAYADRSPALKWMNLGPSMEQFSHTMAAQTDLVLEAAHLDAFNANFAAKAWDDCRFPRVIFRVEDVLVETFEEGSVVTDYAKLFATKPLNGNPGMWEWGMTKLWGRPHKQTAGLRRPDTRLGHFIVTRGEDMWLKMVLNDGLLHADLHPGNILVHAPEDGPPRLVLVDAGMVAKLYGHQKRYFIRLLECLGSGDGIGAARAVLKFSDKQTCVGKEEQEAFFREMDGVFKERCRGYYTGVDVGDILRGVLTCVRLHSVRVDVEYATLILNILCLDSMRKALLPSYNVLDGAQALLEINKFGGRVVGPLGVKAMLPMARALKGRQDRRFLRNLLREEESHEKGEKDYHHHEQEDNASASTESSSSEGTSVEESRLAENSRLASTATAAGAAVGALDAAGYVPFDDHDGAAGEAACSQDTATPEGLELG